ncbi:hypothetical protein ACHAPT_005611 [Fusarium lateritium]
MAALPLEEHKSIWDETERNFWARVRRQRETENSKTEQDYRQSVTEMRMKLSELTGRRTELTESQTRLARELAKVEAELARVSEECEEKAARLERIEQDHRKLRQAQAERQQEIWKKMRRFFKEKRGEDLGSEDDEDPDAEQFLVPEEMPGLSMTNGAATRQDTIDGLTEVTSGQPTDGESMEGIEHHENNTARPTHTPDTIVDVVDADGNVIGPVQRIDPWNQWVEGIQELEILRPVKIRRGRRFNDTHLASIYERSEAKGVKWLACMIQATGEIQTKRCHSCDKNQGAFDDCIIVGGDLFQKCGNCEWNRQGCHDASGETIDILASREKARQQQESKGLQATASPEFEAQTQRAEVQPRSEPTPQLEPQQAARVEERTHLPSHQPSPQPVPQWAPERGSQQAYERSPERLPERVVERALERLPERLHERLPERIPERLPEQLPERLPQRIPERIPPQGPEHLRESAPQRPPEQVAEPVSIRAPERVAEPVYRPVYEPSPVPSSQPTPVQRPDLAPERMIDPVPTVQAPPIQSQPRTEAPRSALPSHAPHSSSTRPDILQPTTEFDTPIKDTRAPDSVQSAREPEQMPTPQEYRVTPGFTPANARSRPPSAEKERPTPASMPIEPSPQPTESPPSEEALEEISRENLILRHNGEYYTYPECVEGVPLVKVDESHPYWESNWPNVRTLIEPQLGRWRQKHQAAIEAGPKQEKGGSSKYQIGRQVNRGIKILEFHETGPISPYQLLSKKYTQSGKGGITSYDTLFRLSETMSELEKFKLDIEPVDWLRQRLHELILAEGVNFSLPRTVHDFYHDPKLTALRYKHGFKNIGRPSGMKARQSQGSPSNTPKPLKKRKSMHSVASTPREASFVDQSPLATQIPMGPETPFSTHLNKKPKFLSPVSGPIHDEFHSEAWTDTDSCSGGEITKDDWRLYQVKNRFFTSSTTVTQYWTWLQSAGCFQHQVLKDVKPVTWGLFKDHIDFHVNLDEIEELVWNIEALRIHIVMRKVSASTDGDRGPRGDVMASFKRDRTMRRFLFFCRERGVKMLRQTTEEIDRRWQLMNSELLQDDRGESSKDLVD